MFCSLPKYTIIMIITIQNINHTRHSFMGVYVYECILVRGVCVSVCVSVCVCVYMRDELSKMVLCHEKSSGYLISHQPPVESHTSRHASIPNRTILKAEYHNSRHSPPTKHKSSIIFSYPENGKTNQDPVNIRLSRKRSDTATVGR